jgi:hypothetical protein
MAQKAFTPDRQVRQRSKAKSLLSSSRVLGQADLLIVPVLIIVPARFSGPHNSSPRPGGSLRIISSDGRIKPKHYLFYKHIRAPHFGF